VIIAFLLAQIFAPCSPAVARLRAEHVRGAELVSRTVVCVDVVLAARARGVDPRLAVSVAWHESRMAPNDESSAGAVGPMQVVPRWWCPEGRRAGCDVVDAGMEALATYTGRYGLREGLARYNAGNDPGPRAWEYADGVLEWL